jgi:hypothetical protein
MKIAKAEVAQIRQETQFTCCAASIAAALKAHGKDYTEADVNKVLGAAPMYGASWESILATVQYFGLRGHLVAPATPRMLKEWTDQGLPVIIGWNPEGRPWSHASTVFDVTEEPDGLHVHVMDPNIPNPSQTTRVLHENEFCQKWSEKMTDSLILRRPALVVEREVTAEGRQVRASTNTPKEASVDKRATDLIAAWGEFIAKKTQPVTSPKGDPNKLKIEAPAQRGKAEQTLHELQRGGGSGGHQNRTKWVEDGSSRKPKHKGKGYED